MKLKLLVAPLLVFLIIIMVIWAVFPTYQELAVQKKELAAAKQKLADVQKENAQAAKLKQELAGNAEYRELLLKYIPQTIQEESVIGNLNALALGEGLVVLNLSVVDNSLKNSANAVSVAANQAETAPAVLLADSISVSVGLVGQYEKIKSFVGRLATLKRGNNIVSLKVVAAPAIAESLQASMVLNFYYFAGNDLAIGANSSIFSKGSFDMSFIEQIKTKLNTNITPINIGEKGKANPFLP